METAQSLAIYLLHVVGFYHLVAGVMVLGPASWTKKFGNKLYSLEFPAEFDARYQLTVRALGAFALLTAAICFQSALVPDNVHRSFVLICLSFLFLLRAILRIVQKDLFYQAYKVEFKRSLYNVGFNIGLAAFAFYLGWVLRA